jgi:hypothetical protein
MFTFLNKSWVLKKNYWIEIMNFSSFILDIDIDGGSNLNSKYLQDSLSKSGLSDNLVDVLLVNSQPRFWPNAFKTDKDRLCKQCFIFLIMFLQSFR